MVCSDFYDTILSMIYSCLTVIFSFFALANINSVIACIIVLNLVALAIVPLVFKKALQEKKQQISDTLKRFNVKLKDSICCIPLMKSYCVEKTVLEDVTVSGQQANHAD